MIYLHEARQISALHSIHRKSKRIRSWDTDAEMGAEDAAILLVYGKKCFVLGGKLLYHHLQCSNTGRNMCVCAVEVYQPTKGQRRTCTKGAPAAVYRFSRIWHTPHLIFRFTLSNQRI